MKKMNLLMALFVALITNMALASEDKTAFETKNVECVFRFQDESMSKVEEVKMVKADINGMIPIPAASVASFKKGDRVYQVLAAGVEKHDNIIIVGADVTVTNTKEGHYGDQMLKGALVLSSAHAYGYIGTTKSQQKSGSEFSNETLMVSCSIPALLEKQ